MKSFIDTHVVVLFFKKRTYILVSQILKKILINLIDENKENFLSRLTIFEIKKD